MDRFEYHIYKNDDGLWKVDGIEDLEEKEFNSYNSAILGIAEFDDEVRENIVDYWEF